jgi:uncharacterized protein YijF (DUF1287 family)
MKAFLFTILVCVWQVSTCLADVGQDIAAAAEDRTRVNITYDSAYVSIPYPLGDVPEDKGVCTDVIIRSYRAVGFDLQQTVHEDMKANFSSYPTHWGLTKPDTNIDHRRVPNLQTYLTRKGASLPITEDPADYLPGDIVTWNVALGLPLMPKNVPHIGIVSNQTNAQGRPLMVHNIGRGPVLDDMIFHFPVIGHYRYRPSS